MIQRRNSYLGLNEIPVLISDTAPYSEYFKVSDVPETLTSGKNFFKIYGNAELLKKNTEILVEVTDANGDPIYHHVNKYIDSNGSRVISIYVYSDTPAGMGRLTILGVAETRPNGNSVPSSWAERYNVKWTSVLAVSPEKPNNSEIIFENAPSATIVERIREFSQYEYVGGTMVTQSSTGTVTYTNAGGGIAYIDIEGAEFTSDMTDMQFTTINHNYSLPAGRTLSPNETINFEPYVIDIINSSRVQVVPWSIDTQTEIASTVADGAGTVGLTWTKNNAGPSSAGQSLGSVMSNASVSPAAIANISTVQTVFQPLTFTTSDFTMSWSQAGTFLSGSNNSQSFASITIKNINPIAGDVHSIRTYVKSQGFSGYVLAGEHVLEDNDIFTSNSSVTPYDSMGDFTSTSAIAEYWNQSSNNTTLEIHDEDFYPSVIQTNFPIMSGVTISGSELFTSDQGLIQFKSKIGVNLYQDNEYAITCNIQSEKARNQGISPSLIEVYISGSNIGGDAVFGHKLTTLQSELEHATVSQTKINSHGNHVSVMKVSSGTMKKTSGAQASSGTKSFNTLKIKGSFESNTVVPVPINNGVVEKQYLDIPFIPSRDTDAHILFIVRQGKWHIGDVSIRGSRQTGFTPNHTFIEVPIPTEQADDILDFRFEFFNPLSVKSNVELEFAGINFSGSNQVITGYNNSLEGSLFIGEGIILEGFEQGG